MRYSLFSILLLTTFFASAENTNNGRLIVHLLDYVATDYVNAVSKGNIIDSFEYEEMLEFSTSISSLTAESKDQLSPQCTEMASTLDQLIKSQASPIEVGTTANLLKKKIIQGFGIEISPSNWPSIENGKLLYKSNCLACHGAAGNGQGPSAAGLEPAPTDFTDTELMQQKSPLQAYHTISFGVEGTSMAPFNTLSEEEKWDLAFYIHTIRAGMEQEPKNGGQIPLTALASKNDVELQEEYKPAVIRWFRAHSGGSQEETTESPLKKALRLINQAEEQVLVGNYEEARSHCLMAYLEGVEPVEQRIKAQSPQLVKDMELQMGLMRGAIEQRKAPEDISAIAKDIRELIETSEQYLEEAEPSFWLTFSLAASVILREGLEAFLVIIIVLSVLRKAGAHKGIKWVHGGWMTALGLGILSWFFVDRLIQLGGMQRELLEGIVALFAVTILFYIGFWMHGKTEARKWSEYVKKRINNLIDKQSMWGLAALSFLVVFREAFESVLFLSAISLDKASNTSSALGLGVLFAFVIVGLVAYLMLKYSKNIPISQLFKVSALLIAVLSVILAGKGVHAIQETGYINVTAFPVHINIAVLGVYPTLQTIGAQLFVLVATWTVWRFQNRKVAATAQA